jgi:5-methylcytosine-specific restriction endonuclease McrA
MEKALIETKELTMNNAMMAKISEVEQSVLKLTSDLQKTGFLNPLVNYRHQFEQLNVYYRDATGDDSHRGIHEACGDYFGFPVPYSKDISTTLRDYVLCRIADDMETAVDKLRMFIAGIKSKTVVISPMGHYVNLSGFGSNDVEWPKILKEFNGKCAYCGKTTALIPEHIVPQSEMAKKSPQSVDLIGGIVPTCGTCNHSKSKQEMESWYRKQPFFSAARLRKIKRHQLMYSLEEL